MPPTPMDQLTLADAVLNRLPPIFRACVGDPGTSSRYAVDMPWKLRGFVYATNGQICCVTPYREEYGAVLDAEESDSKFPPVQDLLGTCLSQTWRDKFQCDPIPLPARPEPSTHFCTTCAGKGRVDECPHCDGDGEHMCDSCEAVHECGICRGRGITPSTVETSTPCEKCYGTGHRPSPYAIDCGPVKIRDDYVRTVIDHRAVLYPSVTDPSNRAVLFVISEAVFGLISPMRNPFRREARV